MLREINVMSILTRKTRERLANKNQDGFDATAQALAKKVTTKGTRLNAAQSQANKALREHYLTQAMLGKGGFLSDREIREIDKTVGKQHDLMQNFFDQISVRRMQGRPFSPQYVEARLRRYSGDARGLFYKFAEAKDSKDTVELYSAVGDANTCFKCSEANGKYYLPGQGTFPGIHCLGRGLCRCTRTPETNPAKAKELRKAA